MKLNNRGFAISTLMYMILILAIILILATLSILSSRKLILDKIKVEIVESIYGVDSDEIVDVENSNLECTYDDENENNMLDLGEKITCEDGINFKESYYAIDVSDSKSVKVLTQYNIDKITYEKYGQKENAKYYPYPKDISSNNIMSGYLTYLRRIGLLKSTDTLNLLDVYDRDEIYWMFSIDFWVEGGYIKDSYEFNDTTDEDEYGYRPVLSLDVTRWGINNFGGNVDDDYYIRVTDDIKFYLSYVETDALYEINNSKIPYSTQLEGSSNLETNLPNIYVYYDSCDDYGITVQLEGSSSIRITGNATSVASAKFNYETNSPDSNSFTCTVDFADVPYPYSPNKSATLTVDVNMNWWYPTGWTPFG